MDDYVTSHILQFPNTIESKYSDTHCTVRSEKEKKKKKEYSFL